ncbi:hypothetical protein TWF730_004771 [Orbilia blumenaviensis]|uniref:Uncharacterized protein n=1 Tax=Orbilia blumenaviensis TaxID=1796055 RepID=A0AAV9TZ79_9PEZI
MEYRGLIAGPKKSSKQETGAVYFGCLGAEHTKITFHPWFHRVPKEYGFYPDARNIDDLSEAIPGKKYSLDDLIDVDWSRVTPGNEVPNDLEIEGEIEEQIRNQIKSIVYGDDDWFTGGKPPATDNKQSGVEKEHLIWWKKQVAREEDGPPEDQFSDQNSFPDATGWPYTDGIEKDDPLIIFDD